MIHAQRMTAQIDGDFVVFLIGMRINKPWLLHKWWPVAAAMPRMLAELRAQPERGLLHAEMWFSRTVIGVQYWRSMDQLLAYAKDRQSAHLPAWAAFNKAVGNNGTVGVWHETYSVRAGEHESIYLNMPAFGLARAGALQPVQPHRDSAAQRLRREA
ncbi:MAG: transcriptional regulator [Burkholderiales bacterium PBB2]|nr:MAG: transcriptional regulator [Burkholderiales bacterium PBB2]